MQHSHGRFRPVHPHMRLQVAFGGECATANFTLKRPFARVCAVVHLKRAFTRQHSVADHALIRIGQFMFDVIDELLQLAGFRRFRHFDEALPGVVVAAWPRQEVGVDGGIARRVRQGGGRKRA